MPILHILFNNYANLAQVNDEKTKQTNMSRRKGQGEKGQGQWYPEFMEI